MARRPRWPGGKADLSRMRQRGYGADP